MASEDRPALLGGLGSVLRLGELSEEPGEATALAVPPLLLRVLARLDSRETFGVARAVEGGNCA